MKDMCIDRIIFDQSLPCCSHQLLDTYRLTFIDQRLEDRELGRCQHDLFLSHAVLDLQLV